MKLSDSGAWRRPAYLPETVKVVEDPIVIGRALAFVRNYGCAIQAGAHIGIWPAILSTRFARVISFEPASYLYPVARDAITASNVVLLRQAVSDISGTVLLHEVEGEKRRRFSGSSRVSAKGTPVSCTRIDDLTSANTKDCGLIMLDIEGHELPALRGATAVLTRDHPVVVVEEGDAARRQRKPGELIAFLDAYGYRLVDAYGYDLIFAPLEKVSC